MSQNILLVSSDTEDITENSVILSNQLFAEDDYAIEECPLNINTIQQSILLLAPDIVVIYCKTAHPNLIETIRILQDKTPKALIVFADYSNDTMLADGIIAGASAFVVDGIQKYNIRSIIDIALTRFAKYQLTKQHTHITPVPSAERRAIDRAKGFLMKTKGISEDSAYQFLRKMAMNQNKRISQISQRLLQTPEMHQ